MKSVTTQKCSNKFMIMFVAVAIATLLLVPQVPKTLAYFTSRIESDKIIFTYEPIEAQVHVYQPSIDSSMVYLSFPEFDMQDLTLTSAELRQVGGMKLTAAEITHTVDTYPLRSWSSQGNEIAVYLDQETVEIPLTNLYPDDTIFYMQISGEANYKGARILFTGLDAIFLEYVPEPVIVDLPPVEGAVEFVTPPEEGVEELPDGSEELIEEDKTGDISDETSPEETDLTVPEPGEDPVTEVPSEEPTQEPAEPAEEPNEIEEPAGNSFEDPENETAEKIAVKPAEVVTGEDEVPSEEAPPSEDSDEEEHVLSGGETQHE